MSPFREKHLAEPQFVCNFTAQKQPTQLLTSYRKRILGYKRASSKVCKTRFLSIHRTNMATSSSLRPGYATLYTYII